MYASTCFTSESLIPKGGNLMNVNTFTRRSLVFNVTLPKLCALPGVPGFLSIATVGNDNPTSLLECDGSANSSQKYLCIVIHCVLLAFCVDFYWKTTTYF